MNNQTDSINPPSPFHAGEQLIQQRLGVRDKMERFGHQVIRDHMPEQHREFYAQLAFVFVGHYDVEGWPWASILFNQPGFISSDDNQHLQIKTKPVTGDPLNKSLHIGNRLGLLGIELETRRRNRLSTHINSVTKNTIELSVDQAFGNCPQYIQQRELQCIAPESMPSKEIMDISQFDQQAKDLINNSDTFFVASYVANDSQSASEGADVSHRGGKPGFIRVDNDHSLTIPDYLGNNHFNTLGNFVENAKAGLLFIDFSHGHILTLTGTVEILWDSADTQFFKGAERLWKFHLDHGRWLKNVLPLRWKLENYSQNTVLTGSWKEAGAAKNADQLKNSWQTYQVTKIVTESSTIKSFYLQTPSDQQPQFKAGQFLTIKAIIDHKEIIRTYTVSSAPADSELRISIKHEQGNNEVSAGLFSSFMHQQMKVGDSLQVKAPTGSFFFDSISKRPALLIAAGIGITPMIAIARHVLQEAIRTRSIQPLILICSARNQAQRAFYEELNQLAESSAGHIQIFWALSQPGSHLIKGVDFHLKGRITKTWLETLIPSENCDVYLCGPNSFMQSQYNSLRELGISDRHIYAEAFGPASLKRDNIHTEPAVAEQSIVIFTDSQLQQAWSKADGNLLEFAQAHGLKPDYGCRSGQCGACKVKLLKGKVAYQQTINAPLNPDEILLCSAVPAAEDENQIPELHIKL